MEFISEELFIKVLRVLDLNGNKLNERHIEKGKKIIHQIKEYPKFDNFLTQQFLEKYVTFIFENRDLIDDVYNQPLINNVKENSFHINIDESTFLSTIEKLSVNGGKHLQESEIEDSLQTFRNLRKNASLDSCISYNFSYDYVKYVYQNRYQIRKFLNKKILDIKKDKNGNYLIDDSYFFRSNNEGGKNSPFWMSVEKSALDINSNPINKDLVLKNMFKENKRETALIAEEIARELRLPVAQYYPAKYIGEKYHIKNKENTDNTNLLSDNIVITPNFLEDGEELITGDRILGIEMDISQTPELIRKYLTNKGVNQSKIEYLISDYKIIMAFNCFINHRDCHNGNWGFIKDKSGNYKISHIFDLEGSLSENKHHIRAIYIGDSMDDEILLRYLLQDKKVREKSKDFLRLNMNEVYSRILYSKGIAVPENMQHEINELIIKQKNIFRELIMKIEDQEIEK